IGVADDATAASWNPAGLIQLETPEISMVAGYNFRREDTTYEAYPEASGPQDVSTVDINYLSAAYPFAALGRNMIVSLNYQHQYDFNKKVQYAYNVTEAAPPLTMNQNVDYDQEGAFKSLSPAVAVQITPEISFGMTLNVWYTGLYENQWESRYRSRGTGTFAGFPFNSRTDIDESYTMDGLYLNSLNPASWQNINFNLGLMWNMTRKMTLGAVFKSPFEARLKHDYFYESSIVYPTFPAADTYNSIRTTDKVILDMPMSYGLGLAYRMSDVFTMDLDVYQTRWSDYVLHDAAGNQTSPISVKSTSESDIDDTVQLRFGMEYLFLYKYSYIFPARAGIFYDPEPAEGSPDDFFGLSLGSGVAYKQIVFDLAYQYRFGRDVRSTTVGNEDSTQDVDQHTVYASVIFHF
ncbi:OmpP1/FadL family transporter, partial [Thermodesulfobacteriota bacterium]